MKKLLIIPILLFTLMFSSTSYAEWTKVTENVMGVSFYVDFDRIRKHDGYVYYWRLFDYLKPSQYGDLSSKMYVQGDCKQFRYKRLSFSFHKEPMGGGIGETGTPPDDWKYPPPNSAVEQILKSVCNWVK